MFDLEMKFVRGDSYFKDIRFSLKDENDVVTVEDLTGWTWLCQARKEYDSTEVMAEVTVDTTQEAQGILTLSIEPAVTATMSAGRWDLQGTKDGRVVTRGGGKVVVQKDVSR